METESPHGRETKTLEVVPSQSQDPKMQSAKNSEMQQKKIENLFEL